MNKNWAFDEIANPNCQQCGLYKTAQTPCLVGQGPRDAKIMIVGEAPSWRRGDTKDAFSGLAGERLDIQLQKFNLSRDKIYITNAIKCRPPDGRTPEKEEIETCKNYLLAEVKVVQPNYLLLLGNPALYALTGMWGITKHRGNVGYLGNIRMLATYHPSAIRRNPQLTPYFDQDFALLSQWITGGKDREPEITIARDLDTLLEVVKHAQSTSAIAYDVETEGLYEWVPFSRLWCLGIATSTDRAWVIPLEHPEHEWTKIEKEEVNRTVADLLSTIKVKRVAHNGEYDNRWLRSRGFKISHDFDTMLAAHLLDENYSKKLEELAKRYLGVKEYKDEVDVTAHPPPLEALCRRCGRDVCYTLGLREVFRPMLQADERLVRVFKFLLMPGSDVISRVESTGIYIDQERLAERTKIAEKEREDRVEELTQFLPDMDAYKLMNWNSPKQLRNLLYTTFKLPVLEYTEKTSEPSTAEPVIKRLKNEHPVIPALLKYRKKDKQISTFLIPWKEWAKWDGRLHPSYNLTGTVTGRASCSDPNLQQSDREEFIRGNIGAQPGWSLISADLAQAEMRIAAMLSQEPNLMRVFRENRDVHDETAKKFTGRITVTPAERKKAKPVNFGLIYGMGWRGLQIYAREKYDVELSDEEAKRYHEAFFELYPGLLEWHKKQKILVKKNHQVRAPLGRIRHLPDIMSTDKEVRAEAERQAINSPVQCLGFEICLLSAIILDPQMSSNEIRLVGLIHDCLLYECRDDIINIWVPKIKEVMENLPLETKFGFKPTVPIKVDIKVSKYWGGEA